MTDACVVGAGSWGTTLAWLMARRGIRVALWARDRGLVERIRATRRNERYLPDLPLPSNIEATDDLAAAVAGRPLVVVVVPSVGMPAVAEALAGTVAPGSIVVSAVKGLEHETGRRMTTLLDHTLAGRAVVAALSGPNLSHEIAAGKPSATVVASADGQAMHRVQELLSSQAFRVYSNPDVAGVELGGALKNPLAIAAGISDGLSLGDNAKAALMTRGMHEIRRLGTALGARSETFAGLCGFGDLLATCHSPHSRNRTLGEWLGHGLNLAEASARTEQVAEGVPTVRTAVLLADQAGVDVPILRQLHGILFEGVPVRVALQNLLGRPVAGELG